MIIRRSRVRVQIEQTMVSLTTSMENGVPPSASVAESPVASPFERACVAPLTADPQGIAPARTPPAQLSPSQPATTSRYPVPPFNQEIR
jgi:hypothetical protein